MLWWLDKPSLALFPKIPNLERFRLKKFQLTKTFVALAGFTDVFNDRNRAKYPKWV